MSLSKGYFICGDDFKLLAGHTCVSTCMTLFTILLELPVTFRSHEGSQSQVLRVEYLQT